MPSSCGTHLTEPLAFRISNGATRPWLVGVAQPLRQPAIELCKEVLRREVGSSGCQGAQPLGKTLAKEK
eukprot:scaffold206489_cov28-Tisochrysis_lutea.AAC.10